MSEERSRPSLGKDFTEKGKCTAENGQPHLTPARKEKGKRTPGLKEGENKKVCTILEKGE